MATNFQITQTTSEDIDSMSDLLSILFSQEADFNPQPKIQKKGLNLILNNKEAGVLLMPRHDNKSIGMVNLL